MRGNEPWKETDCHLGLASKVTETHLDRKYAALRAQQALGLGLGFGEAWEAVSYFFTCLFRVHCFSGGLLLLCLFLIKKLKNQMS